MRLSNARKIFVEAINQSFKFDYKNNYAEKPIWELVRLLYADKLQGTWIYI